MKCERCNGDFGHLWGKPGVCFACSVVQPHEMVEGGQPPTFNAPPKPITRAKPAYWAEYVRGTEAPIPDRVLTSSREDPKAFEPGAVFQLKPPTEGGVEITGKAALTGACDPTPIELDKPEAPSDPWPEDVLRRLGRPQEKPTGWHLAIGAMGACMLMAALLVASYVALRVGPRGDADQEVRDTGWVEISDGNLVYSTGPLPARIPPELKTRHLSDLAIGESTWAVPWAMSTDGRGCWLFPSHMAWGDSGGTSTMLVTRTDEGCEVDISRCLDYTWSDGARPRTPVLAVVKVTR